MIDWLAVFLKEHKMKLFIWDNSIIAVAKTLEEARKMGLKRTTHLKSLADVVINKSPLILNTPCSHIIFTVETK